MSTFRIQVRLNVRPEGGAAFIEHVAPAARAAGLSIRNDAPGLLEADGLSLSDLGQMLMRLGDLPVNFAVAADVAESGLIDDVWVHVSRER